MHPYVPAPIDTSKILLSPALQALTERLAENTHDNWSQQRCATVGRWAPAGMTRPRLTRASFLIRNCPKLKNNTTASRRWRP